MGYEFKSDFLKGYFAHRREDGRELGRDFAHLQGREQGRLLEARRIAVRVAEARIGAIGADLQARIDACDDVERLELLVLELSTAGDPVAVEKLLHEL